MAYGVSMTADAVRDPYRITDYIPEHDLARRGLQVPNAIERTIQALGRQRNQGDQPKELAELGLRNFREGCFKPSRIINLASSSTSSMSTSPRTAVTCLGMTRTLGIAVAAFMALR